MHIKMYRVRKVGIVKLKKIHFLAYKTADLVVSSRKCTSL